MPASEPCGAIAVLIVRREYACAVSLCLLVLHFTAAAQVADDAGAPLAGRGDGLKLPTLAQFQLPGPGTGVRPGLPERPVAELPSELRFSWAIGSDSEFTYRKNADLDDRLYDTQGVFAPTVFSFVDYRPTSWFASRLETTLEVPLEVIDQRPITLPTGEVVPTTKLKPSIVIDQLYGTLKSPGAMFEFTVGRRNFEDPRLWLYDAALDGFILKFSRGYLEVEASLTQENLVDGDLLNDVPRTYIDNYIVYADYRGFEDHRLAAYWIKRDDTKNVTGRPILTGLRAYGRPVDVFSYWVDLGVVRGRDEERRELKGTAFDLGFTMRFPRAPLSPSVTVGYAAGSGDGNTTDAINHEYRQTGLQSNEGRFGGFTQFKRYGETLDPELSNIHIVSAGVGFRPFPNGYVDIVLYRYELDKMAEENRGWALSALMNQDPAVQSKDIGREIDVIVGFRRLFGIHRLGFEVRAGVFSPGKAFRNNVGTAASPSFVRADKAVSVLAVIIL